MKGKREEFHAQGFTLIELMLAIAIAGIVMASFYSVYISQQSSYLRQEEVAGMHQNIRSAMYHMGREIRMAGLDPKGTAGENVEPKPPLGTGEWDPGEWIHSSSDSEKIRFREDVRGKDPGDPPDGDTGDSNEDITYTLDDKDGDGDTDLVRNNYLIAENIKSLIFNYLDGTGAPTVTLSAIRFVDIKLIAVTDNGTSDRTMTARIHCRNLGY